MPRLQSRRALLAAALFAALAAAPGPAHAVVPGPGSARRVLAATLAGDGRVRRPGRARALPAGMRHPCPEPAGASAGTRLALHVEGTLDRWGASARRWAEQRAAIAVYVADVTGLLGLANRLTGERA